MTNIPRAHVQRGGRSRPAKLYVGSAILRGVSETYGDVAPGEPLALVGSAGLLEIGVNGGDAATLLTIHKGSPVNLVFGDP